MDITKCDLCRKLKKEKHHSLDENSRWIGGSVRGRGSWLSFDLCGKCGENLLKYIKKYLKLKKHAKK